eukprot:509979-Rhodomonas_salina.1
MKHVRLHEIPGYPGTWVPVAKYLVLNTSERKSSATLLDRFYPVRIVTNLHRALHKSSQRARSLRWNMFVCTRYPGSEVPGYQRTQLIGGGGELVPSCTLENVFYIAYFVSPYECTRSPPRRVPRETSKCLDHNFRCRQAPPFDLKPLVCVLPAAAVNRGSRRTVSNSQPTTSLTPCHSYKFPARLSAGDSLQVSGHGGTPVPGVPGYTGTRVPGKRVPVPKYTCTGASHRGITSLPPASWPLCPAHGSPTVPVARIPTVGNLCGTRVPRVRSRVCNYGGRGGGTRYVQFWVGVFQTWYVPFACPLPAQTRGAGLRARDAPGGDGQDLNSLLSQ